ncbi:unnamed protein product [Brassica rapa]|uniref:Uncharacterized protein n=2 Tax=Brassica TaxID=3705 RepID=A0A8D9CRG7_BRACM|nr:unnamed protein product [Brassica napus]CAG7860007.1 unnamed protein product [Brassica rapa]
MASVASLWSALLQTFIVSSPMFVLFSFTPDLSGLFFSISRFLCFLLECSSSIVVVFGLILSFLFRCVRWSARLDVPAAVFRSVKS